MTPSGCSRPPTSRRAVAQLAFAAGRIAEQLGDVGGAIERYEAALEAEPRHGHALRGLRRLRLADGKREPVLGMLDREIAAGVGGGAARAARDPRRARARARRSRRGAGVVRSDPEGAARRSRRALGPRRSRRLGRRRRARAGARSPRTRRSAPAMRRHARRCSSSTRRLDEAAGRVREAVARYREALGHEPGGPTAMAAAWGTLRVAVRTPDARRRRRDPRAARRAPARRARCGERSSDAWAWCARARATSRARVRRCKRPPPTAIAWRSPISPSSSAPTGASKRR